MPNLSAVMVVRNEPPVEIEWRSTKEATLAIFSAVATKSYWPDVIRGKALEIMSIRLYWIGCEVSQGPFMMCRYMIVVSCTCGMFEIAIPGMFVHIDFLASSNDTDHGDIISSVVFFLHLEAISQHVFDSVKEL